MCEHPPMLYPFVCAMAGLVYMPVSGKLATATACLSYIFQLHWLGYFRMNFNFECLNIQFSTVSMFVYMLCLFPKITCMVLYCCAHMPVFSHNYNQEVQEYTSMKG